jgi:hypothetical protein
MDYRALSKLLIKIGGLFIILYALKQAYESVGTAYALYAKEAVLTSALIVGGLPVLIPLVLGLALFYFPGVVTNRLLIDDGNPPTTEIKSIARLEEAALILLAVYILVHSLGDAVYWLSRVKLYQVFIDSEYIMRAPPLRAEDFAQLVADCVQIPIALCLFFGAAGLVRLKDKFRGRVVE